MAAEGVRLTQFNTPMAFCAPTRAALLTGRYPLRCGLSTNPAPDEGPKADAVALPPGEITLAQIFRQARLCDRNGREMASRAQVAGAASDPSWL